MTVEFICEQCERDVMLNVASHDDHACQYCKTKYEISPSKSMRAGGKVDHCLSCDSDQFYVQKDINSTLGIAIFIVGVIFSYHTYFISLAVATLINFILYKALGTVTICYRCRAIYRGFEEDPAHRGMDRDLATSLMDEQEKDATVDKPRAAAADKSNTV